MRPYLPYIAALLLALLGSVLGLHGESPTLMGTSGGLLLATSFFYLSDVHRRTGAGSDRKNP